jgi:hypothetical protein
MHFFGKTADPTSEYWIGKGVDYESLWDAYESGDGYMQKFRPMRVHLMRITFREQPKQYPLFNFEAVYKTIKGYFHDLKKSCLTSEEYAVAGPLFIYRVGRSSGVWEFLGELRQILMLGTSLADGKVMGEKLSNLDRKVEFMRKHFGDAGRPEDFEIFMRATTPRQLDRAVRKLIEQGVLKVEVSSKPFTGEIQITEATLIDLKNPPD